MNIIADENKLVDAPKVSILCITFNQIDYIEQALDSFLMQKTEFPFEILVNDDFSTDGTTDVLFSYQERFPELFRIVTHEENQYSKGVSPMGEFLVPLARGEYIAMCEGDDYWTDPEKLQRQFDFMAAHPDMAACVHAHENIMAGSGKVYSTVRYHQGDCKISIEDALSRTLCYSTNSLFVRSSAMKTYRESPIYPLAADGDQKMLVCFSVICGGIQYLDIVMSAYRVLAKGSVNRSMLVSDKRNQIAARKHDNRIALLKTVDACADSCYHAEVEHGLDWMDYYYYRDIRDYRTLKKRWPERFKSESVFSRGDIWLYSRCKPLHKLLFGLYCKI